MQNFGARCVGSGRAPITIEAEAKCRAAPGAIFSLLRDSETWPRWSFFNKAELERGGDGERHGVGAIRSFATRLTQTREELTELDPDRKLGYVLLSGLPLRNYRAEVRLHSIDDGGTTIRWAASFECAFGTGWFWRIVVQQTLSKISAQLTAAAEAGLS